MIESVTCSPVSSSSDEGWTTMADAGSCTAASTSAVRLPLVTVMSELPTAPTDVRRPASSTVSAATSLDRNVNASPVISWPDASTTVASN